MDLKQIRAQERAALWNKTHKERRKIICMNSQWKSLGMLFGDRPFCYDDYNSLFAKQEGCCKICNTHQADLTKALSADHCHETGQVRGLLCQRCNAVLGMAKDNIDILNAAADYLENKSWI